MQNAGQQYGQGGASSQQAAPFGGHTEPTQTSGGSITSSLRQFRRKNEDKHSNSDSNTTSTPTESHVARVAPHSHYPPRSTTECYRYPPQYPDYGFQQPVKYSEISEPHPQLQEHISPSVIQKAKSKEYMEMCNVQQQHMKSSYDHLNGQQSYSEANIHPHAQYIQKEPQVHHGYKPESQYFAKDSQYSPQLPHQLPKYPQMHSQTRKYPQENDFLSKLRRIHPSMARSIMSDHHLQESQSYQSMDQNRIYPLQNQRYINYPSGMQNGPYTHGYMPYSNYPASCSYNRPPQITPRFPPVNPHERSISPRRGYSENVGLSLNYGGIAQQKISPSYPQYNTPEYAQHYQHRRAPMTQEYYQQHCRPTQYLPHQMPPQEMPESRVTVSDSIKHYIENWADEETASEMNQIESSRLCKESLRGREEQSTETVYMINASELQYLENEIVTSENGVPLPVVASETGQYIIKSGVSIVNGSEMMRIVEKTGQVEIDQNGERVVNLHIMDASKPDCMLANKPNELNQRQTNEGFPMADNPRVVVHQNTVLNNGPKNQSMSKESVEIPTDSVKVGTSLPIISDPLEDELNESLITECKKETVDKNCSPINLDEMEDSKDHEELEKSTENSLVEEIASIQEIPDSPKDSPLIDAHIKQEILKTEEHQSSLEVDDPHRHIDTLLEDTINTSQAIETQNEAGFENENKSNIHKQETLKNKDGSNISIKENIVQQNIKNETEFNTIDDDRVTEEKNNIIECPKKEVDIKHECNQNSKQEIIKIEIDESSDEEDVSNQDLNKGGEEKCKEAEINSLTIAHKEEESIIPQSNASLDKTLYRRNRRIFSVDDIMNNIGKKVNLSDNNNLSRRHSLQTTKEFLEKEIKNTFKISDFSEQKNNCINEITVEETKTICSKLNEVKGNESETNDKVLSNVTEIVKETNESDKNMEKDTIVTTTESNTSNDNEIIQDLKLTELNTDDSPIGKEDLTVNKCPDVAVAENIIDESIIEETKEPEADNVSKDNENILESSEHKENANSLQPEVQYRNVIKIEESSVLLEIAGELVEINVNNVNGKNIITVVPISDSAMVDCNDNYENYDASEVTDPLKIDDVADNTENVEVVNFVEETSEPEVVETTSEVIIGMDLSLEEEIKLDVDQPPILYTKAAKKAYDCDLQIPSITTSDDVLDNNRFNTYTSNDKVSSTKEKSKFNKLKKKTSHSDSLKTLELSTTLNNKSDRKSLFRELIAARNRKKHKEENKIDDDDFVPFKELVRARKLKKLKLLKMKSSEDSRIDSTIKIDETLRDNEIISERDKEDEDESTVQVENKILHPILKSSSEDETKSDKNTEKEKKCEYVKSEALKEKEIQPKPIRSKRVSFVEVNHETDPSKGSPSSEKTTKSDNKGSNEILNTKLPLPPENGLIKSLQTKKKLSLEEYNKRKRKLQEAAESSKEIKVLKIERSISEIAKSAVKIKPHRPKSLDDLNLNKPREYCSAKRKLSVEYSPVKQNDFDWEETQSPKINNTKEQNKLSEFKGLLTEGKSKPKILIDVNDFNSKPSSDNSGDEILQNYKVQVESKLSSLNIQIPKTKSIERQIINPFTKSETNRLIDRFLKNEKLSAEEMEKIRQIISYKRLMQQLKKIKLPDNSQITPISSSYEVRKDLGKKETKILLKKIQEKKKARFKNLYSQSDSESDDDFRANQKCGDYSVVQSNCLAGVVPKLIIKRKTEMQVPIVRLERLDLGLLEDKDSQYAV